MRTTKQTTRLSEYASFTVEASDSKNQRKVTYYYQDSDKKLDRLMAVSFPLGAEPIPPVERAMVYDETEKCWSVEVNRPIDAREHFILIPNVSPESELSDKEQAVPVSEGYLSFKNGEQQPVNKVVGVPAGEIQLLLYTEAGEFEDPVSSSELKDGDRLVSVYLPPGYDSKRVLPYNVQIVLDGKQYLDTMQMNTILDNLIATGQIEPVVSVFISPYTGAPNALKKGLPPVTPAGYSISQRFKEYSCNPVFADRLAAIPDALRKKINITTKPSHTTIWGMSMSALQSAYTALLLPEVFGNVVAQSMMSWNIPEHRGVDWRDVITEDWTTSTALLPYVEQHNEHIIQMARTGFDSVSARAITPSTLNFYFDAGNYEDQYDPYGYNLELMSDSEKAADTLYIQTRGLGLAYNVIGLDGKPKNGLIPWDKLPDNFPRDVQNIDDVNQFLVNILQATSKVGHTHSGKGFANLVKGTDLFIKELERKAHTVLGFDVVTGGHDAMTWMGDIPTAATRMSSPLKGMSFIQFDQTPGKGWRALADDKQFQHAGELIKEYFFVNPVVSQSLLPSERCLLWFHAGQMFAMAGNKSDAATAFLMANQEPGALNQSLGNNANAYMRATIAFLKNDRAGVESAFDEIDMDVSQCPRGSNLIFIPGRVHDMLNHMGASYNDIFEMSPSLPPTADNALWERVSQENVWSDTPEGYEIRGRHNLPGNFRMPKESAVEILVYKPAGFPVPPEKRGVHENLWIKKRFKQYVSIGIYLDGSDLKYYFFEDCDNSPKIYSSLLELKQDLPSGLEDIFDNTPKLFVMGHGRGDCYGLGNHPVEICGTDFDKVITDFEEALPEQHDDIFVTLEACNTDNCEQAARGNQEKTFLARLSETHQNMTFCGTGPWDPKDPQTGYRASGGFPTLNVPITAMAGSIWKHGNSVIFYHGDYQIVVRKSMFASTATAKQLKINTMQYAREILGKTSLDEYARENFIIRICANRDTLKIEDLKNVPGFPQEKFEGEGIAILLAKELQILEIEKNNYIHRVQKILARAESGGKFTERDVLIIALGLKNISVFESHEDVRAQVLGNKVLLQLVMVTCGKVLIADPSNDGLIDFLLERGIDINSADEKGMTATHYAVQNFYNYREEPLNLIKKLLDCGANIDVKDKQSRTPLMIIKERSEDQRVSARDQVQKLLEQRRAVSTPAGAYTMRALLSTNLGFFRKLEDKHLEEHRHDDPRLQREYDKRFGLVIKH